MYNFFGFVLRKRKTSYLFSFFFSPGELVIGNEAIDSNWWKGEKDGVSGIFPINYVWKIDRDILPVSNPSKKMFARAKVKMDMKAELPEEMDLYKDEIVNVIEEVEKGWYRFVFEIMFILTLNFLGGRWRDI